MAPAAGVSEGFDGGSCVVRRWRPSCARRRVWSTGDWEAAGEREKDCGVKAEAPFFWVQVSAHSPCICSLSSSPSLDFCLDLLADLE